MSFIKKILIIHRAVKHAVERGITFISSIIMYYLGIGVSSILYTLAKTDKTRGWQQTQKLSPLTKMY